ncbi:hypothetical protein [Amaricoccus solimangrovi]|uniref:Sulfotransferase family protein n=1 Tax=Amaricoccus solimangrovi TaxID=2589815 RepID=A0A501WJ18_9RHOB|nr:hypothetical protein [Amaricoccus solimangrovi]TPE48425.1 hypothetical protein FJM51_17850 [Amaricoccus solimangrovi]
MTSAVMSAEFTAPFSPALVVPLPEVRQWRIHLGAHKTATTHLQNTLTEIRPRLVARGVDPIPLPALRRAGIAQALNERRLATRLPILRGVIAKRILCELLDPLREGPETVILSEEKLLGSPRRVFSDPIYPMVEHIVPTLATLGGRADVTLFLSIRNFAGQLASTYAQELRVLPPPEGGFESIRARVVANPPSWFDLARRIRAVAPNAPLRIWRQEDYRAHKREILSELAGCDTGPLPELADPTRTKSPSLEAIREAEALPRNLSSPERRRIVDAIFANAGEGTRFAPFSKEEEAMFEARYVADLARMRDLDPEMLMRF